MVKVAWVGTMVVALGAFGGCAGDSNGDEPTGGSGGSTASGGSTTSGGSGTSDLSGTWDVILSEPDGGASTATVTLSPTKLEVTGDAELLALVADDVTTIAYEGDSAHATRLSENDMDLGAIPLPFAGLLRFTGVPDENQGCDMELLPSSLSLRCSDDISNPESLPSLQDADLLASRGDSRESIFGDLGGRWAVRGDDIDCSIVLEGSTVVMDCAEAGGDSGQVSLTVDGDSISGSTSEGAEFTARRR